MDDDKNEFVYDRLIEASNKIQEILDMLREHEDDTQSAFEIGALSAAQSIIESAIDPDYPPLVEVWKKRMNDRLFWAIQHTQLAGK